MMAIIGFIVALILFKHFSRRLKHYRQVSLGEEVMDEMPYATSWHQEWERHWAAKFRRQAEWRQWCVDHHHARYEPRRRRRRREREEAELRRADGAPAGTA
ncbi:MAG: hypothetical protein AB1689_22830, partial [Thermodesulfobacteriota bacterium]